MIKKIKNLFNSFAAHPCGMYVLVAVGIVLRVKQYLEYRSLWVDEAWVAISITSRSIREIVSHYPLLIDMPLLPLGFSMTIKSFSLFFGEGEMILRLFPLICGLMALILFFRLVKYHASSASAILMLVFFVFCDSLVYYSAELKQYSTDVMATLLLFLAYERLRSNSYTIKGILWFAIVGCLLMWFSNVNVFVLTSGGVALLSVFIQRRDIKKLLFLIVPYALWIVNFLVIYGLSLDRTVNNRATLVSNVAALAPQGVWTAETFFWFSKVTLAAFVDPLGFRFSFVGLLLFCWGMWIVYQKDRQRFILLVLPIALTLGAGMLRKYPFRDRMILFLVPSVFIILSQGLVHLVEEKNKWIRILAIALTLLVIYNPVMTTATYFFYRRPHDENREVMNFVKENLEADELILMNNSAQYPYWYYVREPSVSTPIPENFHQQRQKEKVQSGYTVARVMDILQFKEKIPYAHLNFSFDMFDAENKFRKAVLFKSLTQKRPVILKYTSLKLAQRERIWFVFSHGDGRLKRFLLESFNRQGELIKSIERNEASAYLFDLR